MKEPRAPRREYAVELFGDVRIDPWFWLRDVDDPDTIPYLEAENAYARWMMEDTLSLQDEFYQELRSRSKEDDASAPEPEGDYAYLTRYHQVG
jgi:oligopeptidase B